MPRSGLATPSLAFAVADPIERQRPDLLNPVLPPEAAGLVVTAFPPSICPEPPASRGLAAAGPRPAAVSARPAPLEKARLDARSAGILPSRVALKANVDTELVLDLVNTADNYDLAFLFSGDSDFERAVDLLRSRGKRIYVVTSRHVMSRELSYVADKPIFFLEDFRAELQRDDRRAPDTGSAAPAPDSRPGA